MPEEKDEQIMSAIKSVIDSDTELIEALALCEKALDVVWPIVRKANTRYMEAIRLYNDLTSSSVCAYWLEQPKFPGTTSPYKLIRDAEKAQEALKGE